MDGWRRFALVDPDLPAHLLPAGWPRDDARELFVEVHTALGPLAQERLVEVMTPAWPDAAVLGDALRRGRRPGRTPGARSALTPRKRFGRRDSVRSRGQMSLQQ